MILVSGATGREFGVIHGSYGRGYFGRQVGNVGDVDKDGQTADMPELARLDHRQKFRTRIAAIPEIDQDGSPELLVSDNRFISGNASAGASSR